MTDEKRYTLAEAQLELNRKECAVFGHDWRVIEHGGGLPNGIVCQRCGISFKVEQASSSALPEG